MKDQILITDYVHEELPKRLKALGLDVRYDQGISLEEIHETIHHYQGIVINSRVKAHQELLSKSHGLKFIARLGSGLEIIDQPLAKQMDIAVFSAPNGNAVAVAEHALGMLLALANNLCNAHQEVRQFLWNRESNRGFELAGKTVGIIGYGHNGSAFAQRLRGFDTHVLAYDIIPEKINPDFARSVDLKTLQRRSDIISLHIPLNAETKHWLNSAFFEKCKTGLILINTSRGPLVKTEDLIAQLKNGQLAGACLDVLENEKPQHYTEKEKELYSQLFEMKNVLLSPHIAGWTHESLFKIADILATKIEQLYRA